MFLKDYILESNPTMISSLINSITITLSSVFEGKSDLLQNLMDITVRKTY